jgi:hypothetical protein
MKVAFALIIALGITFFSYAYTWNQNQSPMMGINGLVFQYHFGLPFYYQTLTSEQIPVIQNSSQGLIETVIYTRFYEFNPVFFLFDWMIWVLPTALVIFYVEKTWFTEAEIEVKKN